MAAAPSGEPVVLIDCDSVILIHFLDVSERGGGRVTASYIAITVHQKLCEIPLHIAGDEASLGILEVLEQGISCTRNRSQRQVLPKIHQLVPMYRYN